MSRKITSFCQDRGRTKSFRKDNMSLPLQSCQLSQVSPVRSCIGEKGQSHKMTMSVMANSHCLIDGCSMIQDGRSTPVAHLHPSCQWKAFAYRGMQGLVRHALSRETPGMCPPSTSCIPYTVKVREPGRHRLCWTSAPAVDSQSCTFCVTL